jgi:isocitrate dehydrogenase (NAD+)
MIMSSVMLLRHLNLHNEANRISEALTQVIEEGAVKTPELGGNSSTTDFTLAVISNL